MSFFSGLEFFILLLILLVPAVIMGLMEKPIGPYSLLVSVVFIGLIYRDPYELGFLITYILLGYLLIRVQLQRLNKNKKSFGFAAVCILLAILPVVLTKSNWQFQNHVFGFLGISYMMFRIIQILMESYQGLIKHLSVYEYISFVAFFPSISSGPIDRSRRYNQDLMSIPSREEYLALLGNGLEKILLGLTYKLVFSNVWFKIMTKLTVDMDLLKLVGYAYSYGFYLFFDFAGYSLMAIGVAYVFGIKLVENFHLPFISKNIKDFWNRWHMSLSFWFRDFLFSPLMLLIRRKKWIKSKTRLALTGYMVNMTTMGFWHGFSLNYVIYGMYHGLLLGLYDIYEKKSKFHTLHREKKWYLWLSWFVTFQAIMFGFLIFSGQINMYLKI